MLFDIRKDRAFATVPLNIEDHDDTLEIFRNYARVILYCSRKPIQTESEISNSLFDIRHLVMKYEKELVYGIENESVENIFKQRLELVLHYFFVQDMKDFYEEIESEISF
ncbi:hypothetical protein AVEN_111797-1 [Araneus ventricosus]|uniref:Uncharacterized protein n=1 Tax=Araneus ventricosus TaxID=182803 RepID=A0A4Y2GE65_ARAVE|nr:hypothetical protein AVEN_111797-1 [Araneus ventricosus]